MAQGERTRGAGREAMQAGDCWTSVRSVADIWVLAAGCHLAPAPAPTTLPPLPASPQIWHRPKCA